MTLELLEGAVNALSDYLQTNMAAKVTELNTRYGDDYELSNIDTWYVGSLPLSVPEYPSVVIQGVNWTPSMQRQANVDGTSRVDLVVFVGDNDLEARFRRLCRYGLALIELCHEDERSIGYIVGVSGAVALTDAIDTPTFLQGIIVPISMGKGETY